jgi:Bacterial archaeo-eukaryotic release factor family 3
VVTRRFHIRPLWPLLSEDGQFYILALSQNQVRLLECTRYSVNQVTLPNTPTSLAEALQYNDSERQLQFHTKTQTLARPGSGERGAIFFGTGAAAEDNKNDLVEYFRQVDHGLAAVVQHAHIPVVLAGVEYLLPLYKAVTTHAAVVEPGMTGNPDELPAETLHEHAWTLVEPLFRQAQEEAVARYQRYAGTGRTSSDLTETVLAASYGRVETVFVALGVQCWGVFDPETQDIDVVPEETPEAEDLLDCAALHTFLNSGTVYAVPPDQVPAPAPLAAILRY